MLTSVVKPLPGFLSENRDKDMVAWKKVYCVMNDGYYNSYKAVIAKLIIPKDAAVIFTNHKCRASYVIVEGFYPCDLLFSPSINKRLPMNIAWSAWDSFFHYEAGKTATPDSFDPDPDAVCSHGIHFLRTYGEADRYDI